MDFEPDPRFGRPRPSSGPRNGVRHDVGRARPVPLADYADGPVDLVAVQADDELINALAAGMTVTSPGNGGYDADDQVAALLAAWRADVDAEPIPDLFDLDTAVAAVQGASTAARPPTRRRWLVPVAAAAAMVVISAGGLSVGAQSAEPGGVMWEVARVVDADRVESVEARQRVEGRIAEARQALESGRSDEAAAVLATVGADLEAVREEEGLAELVALQDFLSDKAAETPVGVPVAADAPLVSDPTRPVPPAVTTLPPTSPTAPGTTSPGGAPGDTAPPAGPAPAPNDPSAVAPGVGSGSPGTGSQPAEGSVEPTTTTPDAETTTRSPDRGSSEGTSNEPTTPPSGTVQPSSAGSNTATTEGGPDPVVGSGQRSATNSATADSPTASAGESTVTSEPAN